jgi:hypothetical protein
VTLILKAFPGAVEVDAPPADAIVWDLTGATP